MSNHDIFQVIKFQIPIVAAFNTYGLSLDRHNRIKCPFHGGGNERTASLTVYPDTNSFYCFGCGSGGTVIDLVCGLFKLEPLAAAQKLNEDFNLGLETDRPPDSTALQSINEDRKLMEAFEAWINNAYITLCDYLHLLWDFKEQYAPKTLSITWDVYFIEACHNIDYLQWLVETLRDGDFDTQVKFFKEYRKEVEEIAARISTYRTGKDTKTA